MLDNSQINMGRGGNVGVAARRGSKNSKWACQANKMFPCGASGSEGWSHVTSKSNHFKGLWDGKVLLSGGLSTSSFILKGKYGDEYLRTQEHLVIYNYRVAGARWCFYQRR